MTDSQQRIHTVEKRRSILRAFLARAIVYGGVGLLFWAYFIGFRDILPRDRVRQSPDSLAKNAASRSEIPAEANEQDWPQWRGLHYDAVSNETNLADSWPEEGPPVLWIKEIGQGYSSVIAVGDSIYTQTQTLTDQMVLALDANTGETIWEHHYGWPYDPGGMYPGPRATPTWVRGKLYFAAPNGLIRCLDAADGKEIWSVNVVEKFHGHGTDFGYSSSPVVEDGKVILPVGGKSASVVALDAATGETVWQSGDAPASYGTALPISFKGRHLAIVFLQNDLACFDLTAGRLLWQRNYSAGYDEHAAAPLYREPYLRVMQPFRGGSDLYIFEKTSEKAGSNNAQEQPVADPSLPRLVRNDKQMSNDVASSVLIDGFVYGFDLREIQSRRQRPSRGEFRCMDFETGEIRWSNQAIGQASIAVADGKLFLFNDRGEAILVRATPDRCEELARTEVFRGEICWTAPCLHHGKLYLRSPTKLACLYVGKPENLDISSRNRAKPTSAISKNNRLDWSWLIKAERDAAFDLPDLRELTAWYLASLIAIVVSVILSFGIHAFYRWRFAKTSRNLSAIAFYLSLLLFGIAATPLGNRISDQFIFTWPVSLFAVHQIALWSIFVAKYSAGKTLNWKGGLGVVLFVVACMIYYDLTKRLSLGAAWFFLPTFLAAWPLAVPAARRILRPEATLRGDLLWLTASFSLYFWLTSILMLWRANAG
jgi:outer membrane protein assembly factor BamB